MRLGFMTVKDMRALPFEEVAKWGAEVGFAALDCQVDEIDTCLRNGIDVGATHLTPNVLTTDDAARQAAQKECCQQIDRAVAKGVKRAMITHTRFPNDARDSVERFAKGYAPVAEYAEQHEFKLVMEIYHGNGTWLAVTPELIRAVFEAVPSRSLGICLDPSHLAVQQIDYLRATKEFGDRIYYSHAKDTEILTEELYEYGVFGRALDTTRPFSGWWRYRLPGRGVVNWPLFLDTLVEVGYDDVLAIEHEDQIWYGSVELNKRGLLLAKQYLDPLLG